MFWAMPCSMQGISSQPGIKPVPPAMKVQNLNHWIARKVPINSILKYTYRAYKTRKMLTWNVNHEENKFLDIYKRHI